MSREQIALIGFMASGKSTLGPRLATRLRRAFVDLDAQIELDAGRSIAEIFESEGEQGFRDRESAALREHLHGPPSVLSTGGGVVEREENRQLLRGRAIPVWLDPPFEVIRRRLLTSGRADRPLVAKLGVQGLRALLDCRRPLYAGVADFRVHSDAMPLARLARELARDLRDVLEREPT